MEALIIKNIKEFEGLQEDWDDLFERSQCKNIFLTFDWHYTWWKNLGGDDDLRIFCVYDQEKLVLIAPLMIKNKKLYNELQYIAYDCSDYEELLIDTNLKDKQVFVDFLMESIYVQKDWDIFRLQGIRQSSQTFSSVNNALLYRHKERLPCLKINGTYDQYSKTLRKKLIKDTERQISRLKKLGKFCYEDQDLTEKELSGVLDEFFKIHQLRTEEKGGKSLYSDEKRQKFFKEIALKFCKKGFLRLERLTVDNKMAAIHFGFVSEEHYYYYSPAFSNEFKQYSIGRILQMELIKYCFEHKFEVFDFMLGDEEYKNQWTSDYEDIYFLLTSRGLKGKIVSAALKNIWIPVKKVLNKSW